MHIRKVLLLVLALAVVEAAAMGGVLAYGTWRGWLSFGNPPPEVEKKDDHHDHASPDRVTLSPQARANLRLVVKPLQLETYSRTIMVPGMVVERQGKSDRGVTSPLSGVVRRIAAVPGETVRPGDELVTLRLNSEPLQNSQTELYKNTREMQITQDQKQRLELAAKSGAIPEARMLDLDYQLRRLAATLQALRYDLAARSLSPEQIQGIADGKFVTEITIRVPGQEALMPPATGTLSPAPDQKVQESPPVYEIEELKVQLGEQVQAGQLLVTLANHQALYIEGRVFKQEAPLLELAAQKGWPVRAEFTEEAKGHWADDLGPFKIQFVGNRVDPVSQTVTAYVPLTNQYRGYTESGKTYHIWRFRPGQRARLFVSVEQFPDVFVLPAEAVVREGPEAYVFRANGDSFDRKPVHVLYEDREHVILANDGSVNVGSFIAFNGAAQLNRALKAKSAGEGGHGHDHHGHSH